MLPLKSKQIAIVASGTVLTAGYTAGTTFSVDEENFLGILIKYSKGDETSFQLKVEMSVDGGTTWYQQTAESVSGGTITATAVERSYAGTGNYATVISPLKVPQQVTAAGNKGLVRISTKATAGTPTGTIGVIVTLGWV